MDIRGLENAKRIILVRDDSLSAADLAELEGVLTAFFNEFGKNLDIVSHEHHLLNDKKGVEHPVFLEVILVR